MRYKTITLLPLFCFIQSMAQDFNYLESLRTYWNYRYHLVGDRINRSQHMPYDNGQSFFFPDHHEENYPDFLSPEGIGEPGMMVVGSVVPSWPEGTLGRTGQIEELLKRVKIN